ncbi:MAG: histidine ammonia-lyase [Phycisphaeraceae bacterium]|nr:histidine ammonia-lyase [Phycisphaeraceae bacterium]
MTPVELTGAPLTLSMVEDVARRGRPVTISPDVISRLAQTRGQIDRVLEDGQPHYGINTGFGSLSRKRIPPDQLRDLQHNLIRSHAAGVGEPLPVPVVRAMLLLLVASLSRGLSGVRPVLVESIVALLNAGITPVVPSVGSVGASGDLAPLAAAALVLIGEGEAFNASRRLSGGESLQSAGLRPIELAAKEGLALINGTHLMAARGALTLCESDRLYSAAVLAAAMSLDACRGTDSSFDARVHLARCQPGQIDVASRLRMLLAGSEIMQSHRENDPRVQDPYCLRCAPQVLGAVGDAYGYVRGCVEHELGAVTDNPLLFPPSREGEPGDIVSGGNFHGMPLAIPMDAMTIATSHLAGISERRTYWLISAFDSESRLRPYLATQPGLHSGMMIAQYTAAACCNEIITLATPASVSNISTSAGIEDYNSFGPRASAKAARAVELARRVIAIELLCAAEGLEAHRPLRSGKGVEAGYETLRSRVSPLRGDRPLTPDIEVIAAMIDDGCFGESAGA